MTVPESVPLAQADDRVQRVVLQQEDAPGGDVGHPLGQGGGLVGIVHHAEGVDDHVSRLRTWGHRVDASVGQ